MVFYKSALPLVYTLYKKESEAIAVLINTTENMKDYERRPFLLSSLDPDALYKVSMRPQTNLEKAVSEAFNKRNHVLASIRLDAAGWAQQLKLRDDVLVLNISPDTRDAIPDKIIEMLT